MAEEVRVLVVDDSAFVRRAVERMLAELPSMRIVGSASNGRDAVELTHELHPDVVILDINMPEMDGLKALERIMAECPTAVLMLSTLTQEGAEATLRALELGAVDFLDKTRTGTMIDIYGLAPILQERVLAAAGASVSGTAGEVEGYTAPEPAPRPRAAVPRPSPYEIVAIGTSTGGPRALMEVLQQLPSDLGASVVIAQHMPAGFTQTLAERLNRRCALDVAEAADGERLEPGRVLVAPGGRQITVERREGSLVTRIREAPDKVLYRPSVDLLFTSIAQVSGRRAIGVVLTGMGDDGARGLQLLQAAGGRTLVESEETAIIFGMPRSARPFAEQVLELRRIGPTIASLCRGADTVSGEEL